MGLFRHEKPRLQWRAINEDERLAAERYLKGKTTSEHIDFWHETSGQANRFLDSMKSKGYNIGDPHIISSGGRIIEETFIYMKEQNPSPDNFLARVAMWASGGLRSAPVRLPLYVSNFQNIEEQVALYADILEFTPKPDFINDHFDQRTVNSWAGRLASPIEEESNETREALAFLIANSYAFRDKTLVDKVPLFKCIPLVAVAEGSGGESSLGSLAGLSDD